MAILIGIAVGFVVGVMVGCYGMFGALMVSSVTDEAETAAGKAAGNRVKMDTEPRKEWRG